jgi:hypothetical protein
VAMDKGKMDKLKMGRPKVETRAGDQETEIV